MKLASKLLTLWTAIITPAAGFYGCGEDSTWYGCPECANADTQKFREECAAEFNAYAKLVDKCVDFKGVDRTKKFMDNCCKDDGNKEECIKCVKETGTCKLLTECIDEFRYREHAHTCAVIGSVAKTKELMDDCCKSSADYDNCVSNYASLGKCPKDDMESTKYGPPIP